jgi:lysophospholipid acyltransferase (LPLAT)-like uncharacterized protein
MAIKFKYKIGIAIIRILSLTWRYKLKGEKPIKPGIIAFWHGFMLPVWKYFSAAKPYGVISLSKDGEILCELLTKWNYKLIRGSSSKGGEDVLDNIIQFAPGNFVLITPDGPKGPANKLKAGAVISAARSEVLLYLCKVKINKKVTFKKSWDSFQLPLLFTSIILDFSKITIDKSSNKEQIAEAIILYENILNSD